MKNHKLTIGGMILAAGATLAHAQTAPTLDTVQSSLSTGVTTAAALVGTVAALFGGIWVYRLIKKGGSKVAN